MLSRVRLLAKFGSAILRYSWRLANARSVNGGLGRVYHRLQRSLYCARATVAARPAARKGKGKLHPGEPDGHDVYVPLRCALYDPGQARLDREHHLALDAQGHPAPQRL